MKSLTISLYHASGKAYWLLSKLFVLLSKSSLCRYISEMRISIGISQGALKTIQKKVQQMAKIEKLCILCMDEMSLKTHLFYSIPRDKIIGLEDFEGGCRTNKVATSALVFMVRGL